MRYTLSNTINKPLDEVITKFKDEEAVKMWMEGLQKIERISGTPHEEGAKSDFYFLHKNRKMKISETILESNLPDQIKFAYHSPMGYNEVEMQFEETGENNVRQTNNSYFELKGLMKIFGFLFKGMFKKQSLKYMTDFKNYCEQ
ncbi:MAG: SRPBCC family protein [Flavobacteriaceae bacterium]|nr:SRPBCC family protein [Bacteroidia bacterium]MBT8288385.1 SRPBCC family protein [Bacteroidia bacterium]NNF75268.1 SRPBCC family protein [Flavobacteriaceae bacterium]NNK72505.1 SRPBCC family protein [Flavobacteriaceae bacterium]